MTANFDDAREHPRMMANGWRYLEMEYMNIHRSFQVAEDGIFNVEITWKLEV